MEKIETIIDRNVAKEHLAPLIRNALFCFISSIVIVGLYILFSILEKNWVAVINIILLVAGIFIFLAGFFFLFMYFSNLKKIGDSSNRIVYEFLDDHLTFTTYKKDEFIQEGKISYSDFIGYKETKNYIFLGLKGNSFVVINKTQSVIDFIKDKGLNKIKAINFKR